MTNDMDNFVPDYLLQALEVEAENGSLNLFSDKINTTPKLRRIEIPQRNSMKHTGHIGEIYISPVNSEDEGEYRKHMDILLMSSLIWNMSPNNRPADDLMQNQELVRHLRNGLGGMTMWEFNEKGERVTDAKQPVCTSPNGVQVWNNLVGKDVYDYRTKLTEKIGFKLNEDGTYTKREHSCIGCPFREWIYIPTGEKDSDGNLKVDSDGNPLTEKYQPMCRETFSWLVWSVDDQELMTIKAVNVGLQMALMGSYSKSGRRYDDTAFKGIESYFSATGQYKTEDGTVVAAFKNQPQGRPSLKNPTAPVYAVRMTATTNNFSPVTIVPQFTILDGKAAPIVAINPKSRVWMDGSLTIPTEERILTPLEYSAFLGSQQTAIAEDYKPKFMAANIVRRHSDNTGVALDAPAATPQLPGAVTDTAKTLDDPFGFSKN